MTDESIHTVLGEAAKDESEAIPLVACTGAKSPRTTPAASPSSGHHTVPAVRRAFGWKQWICANTHRWMSEDKSTRCPVCGTTTFKEDHVDEA